MWKRTMEENKLLIRETSRWRRTDLWKERSVGVRGQDCGTTKNNGRRKARVWKRTRYLEEEQVGGRGRNSEIIWKGTREKKKTRMTNY